MLRKFDYRRGSWAYPAASVDFSPMGEDKCAWDLQAMDPIPRLRLSRNDPTR
jgi:hypothetical protein